MQEEHYCCTDYFYMTFLDNKYYTYFCGCLCLYNFNFKFMFTPLVIANKSNTMYLKLRPCGVNYSLPS